ncbi:MAG: SbcC/MukB-like Walker B domain-containing protein [Verrucomicrobiota bacterium]|nr:SbcC/MukB-like Walker B domain-containing protein [Verrucomicrobiota bacterium]
MSTEQPLLEFFPDADTAGFRLHELSVLNWGTFHGKPYAIRPDGRTAILTGGNGTGKSTLADALLTLLVPNLKRNYNQAGQTQKRAERNEKEYVMGAYSEKHDEVIGRSKQYLRKNAGSYSVLLATFHNEGLNSWVTLVQVLWINTAGKVEKVFIVEPRRLSIEGDFNYLDTPATIRRILKDRGFNGMDSFTAYQDKFHDMLCMPKDKTPMEIFNQAICIKDISDLTSFIREHMLDDGGAAEKLQNLRRNFTELRDTNRRIELATRQLDNLNLIKADHDVLLDLQAELDALLLREQILVPYFAEKEIALRETMAERQALQKVNLEAREIEVGVQIERLTEKLRSVEAAMEQSNEGRRLKEIEQQLIAKAEARELRKQSRRRFDDLLKSWNPARPVVDASTFQELLMNCRTEVPTLLARVQAIEKTELKNKTIDASKLEGDRDRLEKEQRSLLERSSNIPEHCIRARAYLLEELHLKPRDLPFVGELIQVKASEMQWTGAIERLMHSFALCMVVRQDLRERVDAFVHENRQRGLVVYHAVSEKIGEANPRLQADAVAYKLECKPGLAELGRWLEVEVGYRFDHVCCTDTGLRFRESPNALTLNGLVKQKGTERRKDDRNELGDATHYVLGWDNRDKLIAIGTELKALEMKLRDAAQQIKSLETELTGLRNRLAAADKLTTFYTTYTEIDWQGMAREIADLENEQSNLKRSSDRLKELEKQKLETREGIRITEAEKHKIIGEIAVLVADMERNRKAIADATALVASLEQTAARDPRFANFRTKYTAITESLAFPITDLSKLSAAHKEAADGLLRRRREVNRHLDERSQRIKRHMEQFVMNADNIEYKDRLIGDYALPGYSSALHAPFDALRTQLIQEDLPKNQHRFESLLHTTVTDDVTVFDELLERHAKRIERKIQELNQQLHKINFDRRDKTFIQLVPTRTDDLAVKEFRTLRKYALQDSLNETNEKAVLKERYHRIENLLSRLDENPDWTNRVIDVRNWFNFRAEESYRADNSHKQSYSGASGKSGGEKNRLASTILATAIAYQYGISVDDKQTETFRLVAVDEMFSKTDDEFSEYLLELFKEFHLQLLIIQPLDAKIHLVQKYVERYHIVTKRGTNSSVRTLTVHEYKRLRAAP